MRVGGVLAGRGRADERGAGGRVLVGDVFVAVGGQVIRERCAGSGMGWAEC